MAYPWRVRCADCVFVCASVSNGLFSQRVWIGVIHFINGSVAFVHHQALKAHHGLIDQQQNKHKKVG